MARKKNVSTKLTAASVSTAAGSYVATKLITLFDLPSGVGDDLTGVVSGVIAGVIALGAGYAKRENIISDQVYDSFVEPNPIEAAMEDEEEDEDESE